MADPGWGAADGGPTLTLGLASFAPGPAPDGGWGEHGRRLVEQARIADEVGIDRLVVTDHVVMGENIAAYDGGRFPTGPDGAWFEPLTVLSLLAGVTARIRLSTGIILAALRRPVVLAKTTATLDALSGGRLDLGVGVGWQREEYEAAGLDFARRGDLLDEALAVCQALWEGQPASYVSDDLRFDRVWCEPRPVGAGGVPVWVSGRVNRRTLARMVRFGSGWIPWGEHMQDPVPGIASVRRALEAAGRDPVGFGVRVPLRLRSGADGRPDPAATVQAVPELVAAGVTDFNLSGRLPEAPGKVEELLGEVVMCFRQMAGR